MRKYELTYIIQPDLPEEGLKDINARIIALIQGDSGTIERTIEPQRRKLGYPIKKKSEGFLVSIRFSLDPEKVTGLENKIEAEKEILRYLILAKNVKEKTGSKNALRRTKKPFENTEQIEKTTEQKKVELKEIDKKIEEILNES